MTNGEKLRTKTDEELLEFFFGNEAFLISLPIVETQYINGAKVQQTSTIRFIDWMKQEYKGDFL